MAAILHGVIKMWEQLNAADMERAQQRLRDRLAETVSKHEEEMTALRERHTGEVHQLEAKQNELEALDRLIDAFSQEYASDASQPMHGEMTEPTAENSSKEENGAGLPVVEIAAAEEAEPLNRPASLAESLSIRYMPPDFRPFRKFGT